MPIRTILSPLALPLAVLALAPADAVRAEGSGPVAEVVVFRLVPGTPEADFLAAARATAPLAAAQPGFVARSLSKGPDGRWTDHVIWADMAAAQAAVEAVMADPAAAPFLAAIDPATIDMRHETLVALAP